MLCFSRRLGIPDRWKHARPWIRRYRTAREIEHVEVPIGGRGSIRLDIHHAIQARESRPSVLIAFPPGPVVTYPRYENTRSELLSSLLSAQRSATTLVNVNYRLSAPDARNPNDERFRYPQPIHDCSIAFSHILQELIPNLFPPPPASSPWTFSTKPKVALFGTHIGAALATVLALTHPKDINAVAIADPLVDWVILDELLQASRQVSNLPTRAKRSSSSAIPQEDSDAVSVAAECLIDLRTKLFPTPSLFFDPFASPTLFLRAPGRDTPRTHAEAVGLLDESLDFTDHDFEGTDRDDASGVRDEYQSAVRYSIPFRQDQTSRIATADADADADTLTEAIGTDSFGPYGDDPQPTHSQHQPQATSLPPTNDTTPVKRRKVLRRWPPIHHPDSSLLPYFHVFVSPPPLHFPPTNPTSIPNETTHTNNIERGTHAIQKLQAVELVDLLRRACFYGREKGFGEEGVRITLMEGANRGRDCGPGGGGGGERGEKGPAVAAAAGGEKVVGGKRKGGDTAARTGTKDEDMLRLMTAWLTDLRHGL